MEDLQESNQGNYHNNEALNSQWLQQKLKSIWNSTQFCGICLEDSENLCSVTMELIIGRQSIPELLQNIMSYVFNEDVSNIMSSSYVCSQCAEKTIQSYLFIHNTRQLSKIVRSSVTDIYSKSADICDQINYSENEFKNYNIMITLENDAEMYKHIDELRVMTEVTLKDSPKKSVVQHIPEKSVVQHIPKNIGDELNGNIEIKQEVTDNNEIYAIKDKKTIKRAPAAVESLEKDLKYNDKLKPANISLKEGKLVIKPLTTLINPYKCIECSETLSSYRALKDHEKSNHRKAVYQCKLCEKSYNTQQYLNIHYDKSHEKVRCKICQVILPEEHLITHLKQIHGDITFQCNFCDLVYYSSESLETHFKMNHLTNDTKKKPQCIMCLKNFSSYDQLNYHKCKYTCPECPVMPTVQCIHYKYLLSFREQTINHAAKVTCVDCDFVTRRRELLLGHVNREHLDHHPYTCADCGQQFYTKSSLKTHISQFHQDPHLCEYCDCVMKDSSTLQIHRNSCKHTVREFPCNNCVASFDTEGELVSHKSNRHVGGYYPCSLCKKEFTTSQKLEVHHLKVHSGIQIKKRRKILVCTLCDKRYKNIRELVQHESFHGPNIKYPCKMCDKEFNSLRKLYLHNRKHYSKWVRCPDCNKEVTVMFYPQHAIRCPSKKETSFSHVCEICGKAFHFESMLKFHQKTHMEPVPCNLCNKMVKPLGLKRHIDTIHYAKKPEIKRSAENIIKPIACEICGHKMRKRSDLEAHMNRYHYKIKPYVCEICNKNFCGKQRLKEHLATHSTENTCYCSVCGKKFANKVCLKMHFRMHTGEAPYTCDVCGERFRSSSIMKIHRLKKHLKKTIRCPLCTNMFFVVREMRHHFKNVHWKHKDRPFDPREMEELSEEYYYLFEDGRLPKIDTEEIIIESENVLMINDIIEYET